MARISCLSCVVLLLTACENDLREIEAIDRPVDHVDRYSHVIITYSDSAQIRVEIKAPVMESHFDTPEGQEDRFPKGVYVEFFNEQEIAESWLSARRAIRFPDRDLTVVRDSVVLINSSGDTLRTEEMFWDSKKEEIYTSGAFRYSNPRERIYGYKFRTDQNFETHHFEKMSGRLFREIPE